MGFMSDGCKILFLPEFSARVGLASAEARLDFPPIRGICL